MLIGHFLAHYPGPGGMTTMVEGLSRGLEDLGHQVVVFRRVPSEDSSPVGDSGSLNTVSLIMPRRAFAVATRAANASPTELARLSEVDVLVIHGVFSPHSALAARYARSLHIPYVLCPHQSYSPEMFVRRRTVKRIYWHLIEKRLLAGGEAIHVLAPSHSNYLASLKVSTPRFVIPNGWSGPATYVDPIEDAQSGTVKVLYLGRLDIYSKGIDLLLDAVSQVNEDRRLLSLTLTGRASDREMDEITRILTTKGLVGSVSVAGFVPFPTETILAHDLTVLPSRYDGFGLVVIESLALGRPVLVSSQAGVSEYLEDYAESVLCVPPTAQHLAKGLRDAVDRIENMRAQAKLRREEIVAEFSWSRAAELWSESLLNLL